MCELLKRSAVQRQANNDDISEAGISPADLRDSEPGGEDSTVGALEEGQGPAPVQRAPVGTGDVTVQRDGALCPPYNGYSAPVSLEAYNCSGLAHRSYDYKSLADTRTALGAGRSIPPGDRCPAGRVKHWLWDYDMHAEDSAGRRVQGPSHDFHTVAGVSDRSGADPTDVFSKNGKRPVYGPATGPSFRPPPRERATTNHPNETPLSDRSGNPYFKVRTGYTETAFCLPCPSQNAPLQGPPLPPGPEPPSRL